MKCKSWLAAWSCWLHPGSNSVRPQRRVRQPQWTRLTCELLEARIVPALGNPRGERPGTFTRRFARGSASMRPRGNPRGEQGNPEMVAGGRDSASMRPRGNPRGEHTAYKEHQCC